MSISNYTIVDYVNTFLLIIIKKILFAVDIIYPFVEWAPEKYIYFSLILATVSRGSIKLKIYNTIP